MGDVLADFVQYADEDWDAEGALPITADTLKMARAFVAAFPKFANGDIAPGADGSIGFELILNEEFGLWLDIGPANKISGLITKRKQP